MRSGDLKWYHLVLLTFLIVHALAIGFLDLVFGASPESRFYVVDDIIVRAIGLGLVVFGGALGFRKGWAFVGLVSCLALTVVEVLATYDYAASDVLDMSVMAVLLLVLFGIPMVLLIRLKARVSANAQTTEPAD